MTSPPQSVREAHEEFVSGHSGSSGLEVILTISSVFPALLITAIVVQGRCGWRWFMVECVLLVLNLILSLTVLADWNLELWAGVMVMAALALVFGWARGLDIKRREFVDPKRLGCVTSMRAMLNMVVTVSILAVDFHSFPRRFAKTEEYGYSFMDTGAIGFVIINGIVEGRKRPDKWSVVRDSVVLSALGFMRLLLVRATDYQHHVTEYGQHANFFFTIAFIRLTCSWWMWKLKMVGAALLAVSVCICHHILLSGWGWAAGGEGHGVALWVLGPAHRDSLLSANREWVVSLPGYLAAYFFGVALGVMLFTRHRSRANLLYPIWYLAAFLLCCLVAMYHYLGPPSRRLANPTFVSFAAFFSTLVLTQLMTLEALSSAVFPVGLPTVPMLFHAINHFPLLCFLLANLFTGIINKSINTLDVLFPWDFGIIVLYSVGIFSVLYFLFVRETWKRCKIR